MNDRLLKLYESAHVVNGKLTDRLDIEKFAELIVKECMSNLYLHGYDDARTQIKQHFGVEE
jgi:hypothetical protein